MICFSLISLSCAHLHADQTDDEDEDSDEKPSGSIDPKSSFGDLGIFPHSFLEINWLKCKDKQAHTVGWADLLGLSKSLMCNLIFFLSSLKGESLLQPLLPSFRLYMTLCHVLLLMKILVCLVLCILRMWER